MMVYGIVPVGVVEISMHYTKNSHWISNQNSWTCWYECPDCHFGVYDGRTCNQDKTEYCPKCGKKMFYLSPLNCESCKYNSLTMCLHAEMDNPFGEILEDECRKGCPLEVKSND